MPQTQQQQQVKPEVAPRPGHARKRSTGMTLWDNAALVKRRFRVDKTLGQGGNSVVYEALDLEDPKQPKPVALKVIAKQYLEYPEQLDREIAILKTVSHPHIVNLHQHYETPDSHYLAFDLAAGGDLHKFTRTQGALGEVTAANIIRQVLSAVEYIHSKQIVHRDLKPENILLQAECDDPVVMLSDFGISKALAECKKTATFCGTSFYIAPEILESEEYGVQVDMWSLGCLTYFLLFGYPPFIGSNNEVFEKILAGSYDLNRDPELSPEAVDFMKKLMAKDPKKRMTAADTLLHRWLLPQASSSSIDSAPPTPMTPISPSMAAKLGELAHLGSGSCIRIKRKKTL